MCDIFSRLSVFCLYFINIVFPFSHFHPQTHTHTHTHTYIHYIHTPSLSLSLSLSHTHTHNRLQKYNNCENLLTLSAKHQFDLFSTYKFDLFRYRQKNSSLFSANGLLIIGFCTKIRGFIKIFSQ